MSVHPREHQDFVDRILGGELAEGDAATRARLEACPECREELERLRSLDAGLRAAAQEARGGVELARSQVLPADEELVRASLRAALSARGRERAPRRFLLLASAAGLLLFLGVGALLYLRSGGEPAEILLRGGSILCVGPVDAVDDYDEFSWSGTFPVQGSFELRIHVLDHDEAGTKLMTIPCPGPRWIPTPEERRSLPDAIYWFVEAWDVTGAPVDHGWAKAWRRSR